MTTIHDVETFLNHCVQTIGLGFHPDTPFAEYSNEYGPTFTPIEALILDGAMTTAFRICKDAKEDIYELAMETDAWKDANAKMEEYDAELVAMGKNVI